jgi:hypothetical protein
MSGQGVDHEGGVGRIILISQMEKKRSGGAEIVSASFVISPRAGQRASQILEFGRDGQIREMVGKIKRDVDRLLGRFRLTEVQVSESERIEHLEPLMRRLWAIQARERTLKRLQAGVTFLRVGMQHALSIPTKEVTLVIIAE